MWHIQLPWHARGGYNEAHTALLACWEEEMPVYISGWVWWYPHPVVYVPLHPPGYTQHVSRPTAAVCTPGMPGKGLPR